MSISRCQLILLKCCRYLRARHLHPEHTSTSTFILHFDEPRFCPIHLLYNEPTNLDRPDYLPFSLLVRYRRRRTAVAQSRPFASIISSDDRMDDSPLSLYPISTIYNIHIPSFVPPAFVTAATPRAHTITASIDTQTQTRSYAHNPH